MINPGKYRHKITFIQRSQEKNDYGETVDDWVPYRTVWAAYDPLLGTEFFKALTTESKVEVKFNCRFTAGVTNAMRIRYRGKVYEILSAIEVKGLGKELLCYCREVHDG